MPRSWQSCMRAIRTVVATAGSCAIVCCTVSSISGCGNPIQTINGSAEPSHEVVADSLLVGLAYAITASCLKRPLRAEPSRTKRPVTLFGRTEHEPRCAHPGEPTHSPPTVAFSDASNTVRTSPTQPLPWCAGERIPGPTSTIKAASAAPTSQLPLDKDD